MTTVIAATTSVNSTNAQRKVLRTSNGTIWVMSSPFNAVPVLYYSTDDGVNWAASSTAFPESTSNAENTSWRFCSDGYIYIAYANSARTETFVRRGTLNGAHTDIAWSTATSIWVDNDPRSIDLACHEDGGDTIVHVVYSDNGTVLEYRKLVWGFAVGSATSLSTVSGATRAQVDFAHTEADTTAILSSAPHLFVAWVEVTGTAVKCRKAVYTAGSWAFNATRSISSDAASSILVSYFDGVALVMAWRSDATSSQMLVSERNAADTTSTAITNPPSRSGTAEARLAVSYAPGRDIELFQADITAKVLQRIVYDRSGSSWGSWVTIDADADDAFPNTKIGYWSGSKAEAIDLVWTDGAGSPYDIMYERFTFNVAPSTPTWDAPADGSTQDVDESLLLDWTFVDPDAGDTQSAYTLRRRIGVAAYSYWNGTSWQAGEDASTKIASSGDQQTLVASWGADSDDDHYYTIKTWDALDAGPSPWATELRVVPSAQDNPTLVLPAQSAVVGNTADVTWTVATQTKYRAVVSDTSSTTNMDAGTLDFDSGIVVDAGARLVVATFATDGVTRYVRILTYNDETLASDIDEHEVTTSFESPPTPTLVATADTPTGAITIAITNPAPGGGEVDTVSNDLHRRIVGDSDDGIRVATGIAENGSHVDWAVASGVNYEYRATAISATDTSTQSSWTA